MQMEKLCSETKIWVFSPSFLQALYITDMPTTAAWIDHAFGYYQEVFDACCWGSSLNLLLCFPGNSAMLPNWLIDASYMHFAGRRGFPRLRSTRGCLGGRQGGLAWWRGTHWVAQCFFCGVFCHWCCFCLCCCYWFFLILIVLPSVIFVVAVFVIFVVVVSIDVVVAWSGDHQLTE